MALRNGRLKLQDEQERTEQRVLLPLEELARLAGLEAAPRRIEGTISLICTEATRSGPWWFLSKAALLKTAIAVFTSAGPPGR